MATEPVQLVPSDDKDEEAVPLLFAPPDHTERRGSLNTIERDSTYLDPSSVRVTELIAFMERRKRRRISRAAHWRRERHSLDIGVSVRVVFSTPEASRLTFGIPMIFGLVFFSWMNLTIQHRAFSYKNATWMSCFALSVHIGFALLCCYLLIDKHEVTKSPELMILPIGILLIGVVIIIVSFLRPYLKRCWYLMISTNQVKTDCLRRLRGENQYYVRVLFRTLLSDDVLEYRGTMLQDANGKLVPHGHGEWMDSSYYGEYLQGRWQKSRPHAPFISISTTEGNIYYKFWIPFMTTHNWDDTLGLARLEHKYGLAMVTASVSGWFYKKYPKAKVVHLGENLSAVFAHYQPMPYDTEPSDDASRRLPVVTVPRLTVQGAENTGEEADEESGLANYIQQEHSVKQTKSAVVFIHGFNHSFIDGLLEFAQLSALAHWPPHVTPFYFSWPGGSRTDYMSAVVNATSETTAMDLQAFLKQIADQGYTEFHILAHSMAARVVYGFILNGHLGKVFDAPFNGARPSTYELVGNPKRAILRSLILAAPDLELEKVRKIYPLLIPYCRHITLYADPRDIAVGFSAACLHCNETSIGAWSHSLIDMRHVDVIDCYHLEHNTGANYHGYFFMNLSIVGDIRDIVVHKLKARHRSDHLVPKRFDENSFQFKVVPSGFSTVK